MATQSHSLHINIPLTVEASQHTYDSLMEKRLHPQKIYYVHTNHNTSVTNSRYIYSKKTTTYYTISEDHRALLAMSKNFRSKIQKCEDDFRDFFSAIFTEDVTTADKICKKLTSALQDLHPFFSKKTNTIRYLQEKIKHYFVNTIDSYLIDKDAKKNEKHVKTLFDTAIQLTLNNLPQPLEEPFSYTSLDTLWDEFRCIARRPPYDSPFIQVNTIPTAMPSKINVLQSLFDLESVLKEYVLIFQSIVEQHPSKLSKGQLFCLFLQSPGANNYLNELKKIHKIFEPDILFQILVEAIEEEYKRIDAETLKSLYHAILMERNENIDANTLVQETTQFIGEKQRNDNLICIDSEFEKTNNFSLNMGAFFHSQGGTNTINQPNKAYLTLLNHVIRPRWDELFETDIYEVYTFEQLIYLELHHLLQSGSYIRECANPQCNERFITQTRQKKFCANCRQKHLGANRLYRDKNNSRFDKIKKKMYHQCYDNFRNLTRKASLSDDLQNWSRKATEYIRNLDPSFQHTKTNSDIVNQLYDMMPKSLQGFINKKSILKKMEKL